MNKSNSGKLFFKGMAVGVADLIPGVSGGTVALILGIYEKLVGEIRNISHKTVCNTIMRRGKPSDRMDLGFLIPLFAGIALAFVGLSYAMVYMLGEMASATYAFFFIVILGSSLVLFKSEKLVSAKNLAIAGLGFILAFYIVGLDPASLGHSVPLLFITGVLVIIAMILPGISGALVLLFMNQYEYFFDALHEFRIIELLAFGSGAVIGILGFSHALDALLKNHRPGTISLLIGFTLGALRVCYENITVNTDTVFPVFMAVLLGFFVMFMLEARNILHDRS